MPIGASGPDWMDRLRPLLHVRSYPKGAVLRNGLLGHILDGSVRLALAAGDRTMIVDHLFRGDWIGANGYFGESDLATATTRGPCLVGEIGYGRLSAHLKGDLKD